MCDICVIRCAEPGCNTYIPVHIADFCCPREMVEVRCAMHPPEEPGWTAFDLAEDELFADEEELRAPEYATVYMRFIGDPQVLTDAARRQNEKWKQVRHNLHLAAIVYAIGDEGEICPNGPWYEREDGGDGA